MGIKNLAKFLRDKYPELFKTVTLSTFQGKKLALDSQLFLYKLKCANPERWKSNTVHFLLEFRRCNVHPIMVFEGKGPEAKSQTVQKRIATNQKSLRRLDILGDLLSNQSSQTNPTLLKELKDLGQDLNSLKPDSGKLSKYIGSEGEVIESSDRESICGIFDDEKLEREIEKIDKRCVRITKFDQNTLRIICECLGITWVDAPGESEEYCCALAKQGYVDAVLSDDSDCMAYGTPVWLSKFDSKEKPTTVVMLETEKLYSALGFSQEEFIKFCCLCGTDYEDNLPGLGPVKLFNSIKKSEAVKKSEGFDHLWNKKYDIPYNIFTGFRKVESVKFCKLPTRKMLAYLIKRIPEVSVSIDKMYEDSRSAKVTMKEIEEKMKGIVSEEVEEEVEEVEEVIEKQMSGKFHITSTPIPPGWEEFFLKQEVKDVLSKMPEFDPETTAPPMNKVFSAFSYFPSPESITVTIIGQDPYHTPGVANGLAFSSYTSVQPSLKNIYKELISDGFTISDPTKADLSSWAEQGVFLINTALTVEHHLANSHKEHWSKFTSLLFDYINEVSDGMVVVMWGKQAQSYSVHFDDKKHVKIMSSHPSPLGAHQGFIGSKPFSKINEALTKKLGYLEGIDWNL